MTKRPLGRSPSLKSIYERPKVELFFIFNAFYFSYTNSFFTYFLFLFLIIVVGLTHLAWRNHAVTPYCWHLLVQSTSMEMESIPSNGARSACWYFLAPSLRFE